MLTPVDHYGLHWDRSTAWLHQGRGATNFLGLATKSPFQISVKEMCNHLIPSAAPVPDKLQWTAFAATLSDPLVNAMLPIPNGGGFFVSDRHDDLSLYLTSLSRLSSPITSIVKPIWRMKIRQIADELATTNVQPLVLTQATQKDQRLLTDIAKLVNYTPRTVIVTGANDLVVPPPMQRISTDIRDTDIHDLMTLPLENIGATILRRFARKEDITTIQEPRKK